MVSSSVSTIVHVVGWYYIPDLATQNVLRVLHRLTSKLGRPPPAPQTARYYEHYRYTYAVTVLGYLLYTLIHSARSLEPNFYELLGVSPEADDGRLRIAFRSFAKKFHPDKVANDEGQAGQEVFMAARDAFDALKNPVVRFAYDRFGPSVLSWTDCESKGDFIKRGLISFSIYYGVSLVGLLFWSSIGDSSTSFWRYLIFASLCAAELSLLLSPTPLRVDSNLSRFGFGTPVSDLPALAGLSRSFSPSVLRAFFPSRVVYQHVRFIRQLFVVLSVALARVVPRLFPAKVSGDATTVERMRVLAAAADREASILLHTELHTLVPVSSNREESVNRVTFSAIRPHPALGESQHHSVLFKEMENVLLEKSLRQDIGPLKSAWEAALTRARGGPRRRGSDAGDGNSVRDDSGNISQSEQLVQRHGDHL